MLNESLTAALTVSNLGAGRDPNQAMNGRAWGGESVAEFRTLTPGGHGRYGRGSSRSVASADSSFSNGCT